MRPTPIFDTNIFGHVQEGLISQRDWRFLLAHRPRHGWALSSVTALELLAGLSNVSAEKFLKAREQFELARTLSKGRVPLGEPRFLLCKEVLHIPFPDKLAHIRPELLADYIEVVHCAKSLEDIRTCRVRVKRLLTRGHGYEGFSGFDKSVIRELVAGQTSPKREWIRGLEAVASDVYPRWLEHYAETGKRLPDEMRSNLELPSAWHAEKKKFPETILEWLEGDRTPELVAEIAKRFDAVFEFTLSVDREFLLRNYNPEKHESDVYDQFQLHYLAMDRFVIISEDKNLQTRTARSSQASRIMSFNEFLKTL